MRVPRERLELRPAVEGRESRAGWLVIDLKGMDLEGVRHLEVDLDQVEGLRQQQAQAGSLLESLKRSLPPESPGS
jgi:hypothetical protein